MVHTSTLINRLGNPNLLRNVLNLVAVLLLGLSAIWLAKITWALITPAPAINSTAINMSNVSVSSDRGVNVRRIQQLHLFGEASSGAAQQVVDAPETTLNVRLVGVTASSNPELSAAIIQQGSNQQTYIPGDTIQGSRAVVNEILSDRVLLENGGRVETLWLEGRDGSEAPLSLVTSSSSSTARNVAAEQNDVELSSQQQELLDLISIQPERNGSELLGYRISPKGDAAKFAELGFEAGDIAIAINGYDLTNMVEAVELMNEIQGMTEAQVSVLRNGEIIDIDIYLTSE
ncbi:MULTISPECIES: type II secretion system protein GspC [Gammaproteobacteria]|uniref:type II secretion system protein GspC n=1 Tax=Gammaproteobacteria TaxID=1236 RepID=UPI000DD098B7|nr:MULTISPECIES: type II secretion system protein GspC [Gammaproteobacteria]RTE86206.1 type II secretion system protein GspC [Aliidiomarina sp. B3213]TCZ91558.1 type II secretion system protein GspC [Lysobacter sp. N42]